MARPLIDITPRGRTPVDIDQYRPRDERDPVYVLGRGAFKWVWVVNPRDKYVVVNATNNQRGSTRREREDTMYEQVKEFEFTTALHAAMPGLIPAVYEIAPNYRDVAGRYIYFKERTTELPYSSTTFYQMVDLVERCLEGDMAYVDIKPENLGMLNGRVVIIDTDPAFFYRLPKNAALKAYYRTAILMIIMGYCSVQRVCRRHVLSEFIRDKLSLQEIDLVCRLPDLSHYREAIAEASSGLVEPCIRAARRRFPNIDNTNIKDKIAGDIQLPFQMCTHYTLGRSGTSAERARDLYDFFRELSRVPCINTPAQAAAAAAAVAPPTREALALAREQARADANAQAQAIARAQAQEQARAQAQAKANADAKARADEKAKANADAKARADEKARANANAKAKADEKARADAKAQGMAEAYVPGQGGFKHHPINPERYAPAQADVRPQELLPGEGGFKLRPGVDYSSGFKLNPAEGGPYVRQHRNPKNYEPVPNFMEEQRRALAYQENVQRSRLKADIAKQDAANFANQQYALYPAYLPQITADYQRKIAEIDEALRIELNIHEARRQGQTVLTPMNNL